MHGGIVKKVSIETNNYDYFMVIYLSLKLGKYVIYGSVWN